MDGDAFLAALSVKRLLAREIALGHSKHSGCLISLIRRDQAGSRAPASTLASMRAGKPIGACRAMPAFRRNSTGRVRQCEVGQGAVAGTAALQRCWRRDRRLQGSRRLSASYHASMPGRKELELSVFFGVCNDVCITGQCRAIRELGSADPAAARSSPPLQRGCRTRWMPVAFQGRRRRASALRSGDHPRH